MAGRNRSSKRTPAPPPRGRGPYTSGVRVAFFSDLLGCFRGSKVQKRDILLALGRAPRPRGPAVCDDRLGLVMSDWQPKPRL